VSNISAEIAGAFRAATLRPTAQRYAVLDFLVRHPFHATAEEILEAINRDDPRSSRATVYNSLNALVQAGLVREMAGDGKSTRFDAHLRRHHHFRCERCGAVEDVPWFEVPVPASGRALGKHRITGCEVVFRGLCERCSSVAAARKPRGGKP
jgi:Fur family transcriptional regulator, peroxide stress response regulator